MSLLEIIGLAGVAVFAATGVLEVGRKPIDLFGVVVIAMVAALGGGTLRDLLLDRPVFWVVDQAYIVVALAAGIVTFIAARLVRVPARLFLVPDALGLALFTVLGTQIALDLGVAWFVASIMGVVTGVFGGILRDVLCNEVPLVFGSELYATAAWTGALLLVLLHARGFDGAAAVVPPMLIIFAMRVAGMRWHITLPKFTAR
jgi:uncharacterized membrane protein YeiH